MASNIIQLKRITDLRAGGEVKWFMAVLKSTGKLVTVYINHEPLRPLLAEWNYFSIMNANFNTVKSVVQLSRTSRVYKLKEQGFTYDTTEEENFFDTAQISIEDALRSPAKRRLSVTGYVENARLEESPNKKRRFELVLNEEASSSPLYSSASSITVKLWGEKINKYEELLCNSTKVSIRNMTKDVFEAKSGRLYHSLNSTDETVVTAIDEVDIDQTVKVEAMNIENNKAYLLTSSGEQLLLSDVSQFDIVWQRIPCIMAVTRQGSVIKSYSFETEENSKENAEKENAEKEKAD